VEDTYLEGDHKPEFRCVHAYSDRDYDVFGILAGVREPDWPSISIPRGLPGDVCLPTWQDWQSCGGHTPSWLTFKEIKAYDWSVSIAKVAFTTLEEAKRVKETGARPDVSAKWAASAMGWVEVEWVETAEQAARRFLNAVIPRLEEIAKSDGLTDDEVRIVFWFDS
jgi:hypothetical protein